MGHSLSWYDASLHHLVHHSSVVAPGCNIYHSDILVVTANVWIPEMLSSPNSLHISTSPTCSTIPISISTINNHHLSVTNVNHSDDSNEDNHDDEEENINSTGLNSNHLQQFHHNGICQSMEMIFCLFTIIIIINNNNRQQFMKMIMFGMND